MDDEQIIITPAQAETLLPDGDYIHSYRNPAAGLMIGCDMSRKDAIEAFHAAKLIEIGGPSCHATNHAVVVWDTERSVLFFASDPERLAIFEADWLKSEQCNDAEIM